MAKLAVDVVLLPPEEIMTLAMKFNRTYARQGGKRIVLNKRTCLPHITLTMGVIDTSDLARIETALRDIAKRFIPIRLTIPKLSLHQEHGTISFTITGRRLQKLHETVMRRMTAFFGKAVTREMFHGHSGSPDYVRNFAKKSAFGNFTPHVTLGYASSPPPLKTPIKFNNSKLALCQLGNHATCRSVLLEFS